MKEIIQKVKRKSLTSKWRCATIHSKKEKNMSVLVVAYSENGCAMASDSRLTFVGGGHTDLKEKIRNVGDMIIGQIGLVHIKVNGEMLNLGDTLVDLICQGNTIEEALNTVDESTGKIYWDLIPEGEKISLCYFKKNGEKFIADISSKKEIINVAKEGNRLFSNASGDCSALVTEMSKLISINVYDNVDDLERKASFIVSSIIEFEKNREQITKNPSKIGGPLQTAVIKFED